MKSTFCHSRCFPFASLIVVCALFGCSSDNDNAVECIAKDCVSACQEQGFDEGSCSGKGRCECGPLDEDPYTWDTGTSELDSQTDSETDPDTGTDPEQETEPPTDSEPLPDSESDTGTGDPVDTDSGSGSDGDADGGSGSD